MKTVNLKTFVEFTPIEKNVLIMSLECLKEVVDDVLQDTNTPIEAEPVLQERIKAFESIRQKLGI